MSDVQLFREALSGTLDQERRPVRLHWGKTQASLEQALLVQRLEIAEGLMTGIAGHLTCLSSRADLPGNAFLGLPVTVQFVTDAGKLHAISAIVTACSAGQSDGSLACYQLTISDALSVMERRVNSRMFRGKSLPDILDVLMREWTQRSPALASAFEFDLSGLTRSRYPTRELTRQVNESDAAFIRRLLRRDGANVFVRAGRASNNDDTGDSPVHTLVFFDDPMKLPQTTAGTVRYHRDAGTEERDTVQLWAESQTLIAGAIRRSSWDYKVAAMSQTDQVTIVDQGKAGNDLARLLSDSATDSPHAGDSWADYDRIGKDRMLAHELRAQSVHGAGTVRDLAVGHWFTLTGHPAVDLRPAEQRQFIVTSLRHQAENNLPKEFNERAQALLNASSSVFGTPAASGNSGSVSNSDTRYENGFTCVRRGVALTPAYDPRIDLPVVHPITATVVGPKDEEVFCDESGRIRVQIQGLNSEDHTHAQGAGTNGNETDSAPVRVVSALAGANFGENTVPRIGMEVLLDHIDGDPDRLVVIGVLSNGSNTPATFSHTGALPGNRYVSGRKTKEIKGQRYNQLRFDDTAGQISSQLASEHAFSQLNLGYLTQPRTDGNGDARGEGAELRTDAAAALRAAQGVLLTTYARSQASGHQLDRDELIQLLAECTELFKSLGDYAGQHGGQAADTAGQNEIVSAFKSWNPTDSTQSSTGSSQALMAFGAQAGSVNITPKTHVTYAGENVDQVAQQHLQLMSGQRFNATAGQGMQLFARGTGVQAIAGEGPLLLQAQADALTANAQKGVRISTNENEVLVTAPTIRLVAEDGSYVKIGGGVTLGTNGDVKILSASHQWGGPSTQTATKTAFNNTPTDQRFKLHYPGHTEASPAVAAQQPYRMTLDDGRVIEGKTDANGLTDLVKDDAMRILKVDILKPAL